MAARKPRPLPSVHHVPGVIFTPLDGRAYVINTGLEVFEIIRKWKLLDQDWRRLTEAYHWSTFDDLNAALTFYQLNPEIVDERLEAEERVNLEEVWAEFPDSRPPYR